MKNVDPCIPQFYYLKWGVMEYTLHGYVIMMSWYVFIFVTSLFNFRSNIYSVFHF